MEMENTELNDTTSHTEPFKATEEKFPTPNTDGPMERQHHDAKRRSILQNIDWHPNVEWYKWVVFQMFSGVKMN